MTVEPKISEIAERISAMRELCDFTAEDMAAELDITPEEYLTYESGTRDFSFTFLYKCAEKFGIDMIELLTGDNPHLSECSVVRKGHGLPMKRRKGFTYNHIAPTFKYKIAEPFVVTAPYIEEEQNAPVATSTHEGQEMDFILEGTLRFVHDGREVELREGDCVYYNSGMPHGMIATSKGGCTFIAVVMKDGARQ